MEKFINCQGAGPIKDASDALNLCIYHLNPMKTGKLVHFLLKYCKNDLSTVKKCISSLN